MAVFESTVIVTVADGFETSNGSDDRSHTVEGDAAPSVGMDLVEDTLAVDIGTFLARPLFCFLATESPDGPRVSPLWYLWEEGAVWIVVNPERKSYPGRIERESRTALAVVDFDVCRGLVQHVGMRGHANVGAFGPSRAKRLFQRYLGPEERWDGRFHAVFERSDRYRFVRFEPETVVARDQSYAPAGPGL